MEQNKDQIGAVHALPSDLTEREQIELLCQVETYMSITEKHSQTAPEAVAEENRMYCMVNSFIAKRFSDIGAAVRGEAVADSELALAELASEAHSNGNDWNLLIAPLVERVRAGFVSARAADAPSEPSELQIQKMLMALLQCAASELSDYAPSLMEAYERDVRNVYGAIVKSRAADALDSQPIEPYKLESNEQYNVQMAAIGAAAFGYCKLDGIQPEYMTQPLRDVVALYEKYAALLASSQPTDGGVRNG